jgi:hypothetical protein
MPDPIVWGTLPKAQDDSTTIDQAIAAAIAVHADDPTSHTVTGQSLDLHRSNDTIDHPAGSVLSDKNTMSEWDFHPDAGNDYYFSTVQNNSFWDISNPPSFSVGAFGSGEYCFREGDPNGVPSVLDYTKELLVQWTVVPYINANADGWLFLGEESSHLPNKGFGFHFDGLTLYGFYYKTGTRVETGSLTYIPSALNILRATYDPVLDTFSFYINGTIAGTLSAAGTTKVTGEGRFVQGAFAKNSSADFTLTWVDIYFSTSI